MPSIQWFPGHMHSALQKIKSALKNVDLVLELLDARCPKASSNPLIAESLKNKPVLKLLNKADLADPLQNKKWCAFLNTLPHTQALLMNAREKKEVMRAFNFSKKILPHRGTPVKPLRVMVLGVPNVGKSTFFNGVLKKKLAQTGDVPALTKAVQRVDVSSSLVLFDTPGLMWHKIEEESAGFFLAITNTIGVNAFDTMETALFFIRFLKETYPLLLEKRYAFSLKEEDGAENILNKVAVRCAAFQKGGEVDEEKAAGILLNDFRRGALGKITLETPPEF